MSCKATSLKRLQTAEFLARIVGWLGDPVKVADIDTISFSAYILEEATGDENAVTAFQNIALTPVTNYISDDLLLNSKWTEDNIGYNFHFIPSADIFDERGSTYLIRVTLVPVDTAYESLVAVFLVEVE